MAVGVRKKTSKVFKNPSNTQQSTKKKTRVKINVNEIQNN